MIETLIEQIPDSVAMVLLVIVILFNFFIVVGKGIYFYFQKKEEKGAIDSLEKKVDEMKKEIKEMNDKAMDRVSDIEKTANDATAQIGIICAHYESEVKFRKMLEDKVVNIEKKLDGNGKPSLITEIELLKQKIDTISNQIKDIADYGKKK